MKKVILFCAMFVVMIALAACETVTTSTTDGVVTTSTNAVVTTTTIPVVTTTTTVEEIDPLVDQIFEYVISNEGTDYVNLLHFYDNGVFYYSKYNNGQYQAGYYVVSDAGSYEFHSAGNDYAAPTDITKTTMYQITFYDRDGVTEIATAGWDGIETIVGYSLQGDRDFIANPDSEWTSADETGVVFAIYMIEDDDYSTVLINHNGTFQDTIGLFIEGTWSYADDVYTLIPTEGDEYTLTISEDGATAEYVNGATTMTLYAPVEALVVYTFNGSVTDANGDIDAVLNLLDDESVVLALDYYGATQIEVEGTWSLSVDETTFTFDFDGTEYSATLNESTGDYSFDYALSVTQNITLVYATDIGPLLLFAFTSPNTQTLELYNDGTFIYNYAAYGIVETGTWTWQSWAFAMTQSNEAVLSGSMDGSYKISVTYIAVASSMISTTFTVEAAVWGAAWGATGSYTPILPEPEVLITFTSPNTQTLVLYDDLTYEYQYAAYGITETGTWSWTSWSFTLTQSNSTVLNGSMDGAYTISITYVAVASSMISTTFTVAAVVWGAAWGATGSYVPA